MDCLWCITEVRMPALRPLGKSCVFEVQQARRRLFTGKVPSMQFAFSKHYICHLNT